MVAKRVPHPPIPVADTVMVELPWGVARDIYKYCVLYKVPFCLSVLRSELHMLFHEPLEPLEPEEPKALAGEPDAN